MSAEGELSQATKDLVIAFRTASEAAKKSAEAIQKEARDRNTANLAALGGSLAGIAGAAIGSLATPGSNSTDALEAATRALAAALPVIGAIVGGTVGLAGGPVGAGVGGAAGAAAGGAAGALLSRETSPYFDARNRAISDVQGLTAGRNAAGVGTDPETLARMLEISQVRAYRVIQGDASTRNLSTRIVPGSR